MKKPINPKLHGINDYGFAVVLALAPTLFKLRGPAKGLAYFQAANTVVFNGLSDHPVAIRRTFSFNPTHKVLDVVNVVSLLVTPYLIGATTQRPARRFFGGIFLAAAAHVLLTDYNGDTEG